MNNGYVLSKGLIQRLANENKEVIVLGTGALARDFQRKLRLLGLRAPFLVGDRDDHENGVRHYKRLLELKNPLGYMFILCFDTDEFETFAHACSLVYKILGASPQNHPNVIQFATYKTVEARAGKYLIDTHAEGGHEREGTLYTVFGNAQDKSAFKIHLLGSSTVSGAYSHTARALPEILHEKLKNSGFNVAVYSWGQPNKSVPSNFVSLLRDVIYYKPNYVILSSHLLGYDPTNELRRNVIPVREKNNLTRATASIMSEYTGEKNNGIDHDVDYPSLFAMQNRMFCALSKYNGFGFMHIILSFPRAMSEALSYNLLGLSKGYLARMRERKDALVAAADSESVRDYADIFGNASDIYDIFTDRVHLTEKGNEIFAQKLAKDLIARIPHIKEKD